MKVLWFSTTSANADEYYNEELKGTGGWLKSLDNSLQQHVELNIAFYSIRDESFKYKETFYYSIKRNQNVFIKILNRLGHSFFDKEDINKYLTIIESVKPDIIHIHGTELPFACIIPLVKIPVVVSIQGNITIYFHKFLSGFDKYYLRITDKRTTSIKAMLFPQRFLLSYRLFEKIKTREKNNLQITKYIIGRTLWDKRITRIMAPNSIYFHVDEILRDSFYHTQWAPHFGTKIIIHSTNGNTFYKGFETLCLALNELNRIGINCEWRVAGIKPNDLIIKITKKYLKTKFPSKGLILLGSLNEKSLVEKLLEADIFVMPSHIENSPNNLCEAMMLGVPCISTFVGGTGSLLKDGEDGILVQDGDPWAIAGAILELTNNNERATQLGRKARTVAMKRHDKGRIVDALIETYECIINNEINISYK
jgi:glycosyltransferase involved in cell wall biosynthesis